MLSGFFPAHDLGSQAVILFTENRHILLPDGVICLRRCHHRLHRNLLEAQICHVQYIFGKIQIVMGKCTSHIIVGLIPALGHLLELGHDLVVAALAAPERTHHVVDLFSAVQA